MEIGTTSLQKNVSIQTELEDIAPLKHKAAVYDKVDNTKRCELIRIVFLTNDVLSPNFIAARR